MAEQNFKIKKGLSVGNNEIITEDGNLTLPSGANITVGGEALDALPDQAGQTGKYLTTNGADASWSTITQYTPATDQGADKFLSGDGTYKEIDLVTKQDTLVSGTNIKTINNESILGSGNISVLGALEQAIDSDKLNGLTASNYIRFYNQSDAPLTVEDGAIWKDSDTEILFMASVVDGVTTWFEI